MTPKKIIRPEYISIQMVFRILTVQHDDLSPLMQEIQFIEGWQYQYYNLKAVQTLLQRKQQKPQKYDFDEYDQMSKIPIQYGYFSAYYHQRFLTNNEQSSHALLHFFKCNQKVILKYLKLYSESFGTLEIYFGLCSAAPLEIPFRFNAELLSLLQQLQLKSIIIEPRMSFKN